MDKRIIGSQYEVIPAKDKKSDTYFVNSKEIGLKEMGMIAVIFEMKRCEPERKLTISNLTELVADGKSCTMATLQRLEKNGYVHKWKFRDSNGKINGWKYIVYEDCKDNPYFIGKQGGVK